MACTSPLYAVSVGTTAAGKRDLKVMPFYKPLADELMSFSFDGHLYRAKDVITLPCGQCMACRLQRSREWANRCILELKYHKEAYFVTLTYDDAHLHYGSDPDNGLATMPTLCKRDTQLFFKALRNAGQKVRFFGCGEYGTQTLRPHYHFIIFGLHLDDLTVYKNVKIGEDIYIYYTSEFLSKCWTDYDFDCKPRGYVIVGDVSWQSCAYVARYVTKKLTGDQGLSAYEAIGIEAPWSNMSRRPGIAAQYFIDHPDCMDVSYINIDTPTGGKRFRPPKYFIRMYEELDPDGCAAYKDRMSAYAKEVQDIKLSRTDKNLLDYLADEERRVDSRIKKLVREEL